MDTKETIQIVIGKCRLHRLIIARAFVAAQPARLIQGTWPDGRRTASERTPRDKSIPLRSSSALHTTRD